MAKHCLFLSADTYQNSKGKKHVDHKKVSNHESYHKEESEPNCAREYKNCIAENHSDGPIYFHDTCTSTKYKGKENYDVKGSRWRSFKHPYTLLILIELVM